MRRLVIAACALGLLSCAEKVGNDDGDGGFVDPPEGFVPIGTATSDPVLAFDHPCDANDASPLLLRAAAFSAADTVEVVFDYTLVANDAGAVPVVHIAACVDDDTTIRLATWVAGEGPFGDVDALRMATTLIDVSDLDLKSGELLTLYNAVEGSAVEVVVP